MRAPVRLLRLLATAAVVVPSLWAAAPAEATGLPFGPDVSSWQHPNGVAIDWAKVKAGGSSFAIVKATEGSGYTNPYYATDVKNARANKLVVGAYAYVHPGLPISSTATAQAKYLAQVIGSQATAGTLPPIMDLEDAGGLSQGDLITWTQAFLEAVRSQTGRTPIVYSYPYFWSSRMGSTTALGRYPLWLASYTSTTPGPLPGWNAWTLWQYTSTATVSGIPGTNAVDVSKFNGTLTQLAALANGTVATTWKVTAPLAPVGVAAAPAVKAATVSWRPSDDGGQLPSSYTVTASPGGAKVVVAGTTTRATVSGLTPGTSYTFKVTATNSAGTSALSAASNAVVPGQVPTTPGTPTAQLAPGTVTLSWPASSGSPTTYQVLRCSPAPCTPATVVAKVTAPTTSFTDTPVTNGSAYSYAVKAANGWGTSAASPSVTVTPYGPPSAPTSLAGTVDVNTVSLTWSPPVLTGGAAVSAYTVTTDGASPVTLAASARSFRVSGLSPSTHTLAVRAVNTYGTGRAAAVTAYVVPPSSVSISLPKTGPVSGQAMTVSLLVRRPDTGAALANVPVTVSFTPRAGTAPAAVKVVTNTYGVATTTFQPLVTGTVRAVVATSSTVLGSSAAVVAAVRPALSAALSATTVQVRHTVVLSGATSPLLAGQRVYREGYWNGAWHLVASGTIDSTGHYAFAVTPTVVAPAYLAVWVPGNWLTTAGASRTVVLTVKS